MTIRDVAARAGVSAATVSRAFGQPHAVHPETRRRVMDAARELRYAPNAAARSLAKGRTGSLGLVVPDVADTFFGAIVKSVLHRARAQGYPMYVAEADLRRDDWRAVAARVDGLILATPDDSDHDIRDLADAVPLVMTNRVVDGIPSVLMDASSGMAQAVEHLHALGHRDVAYLAGPDIYANRNRLRAFRETCGRLRVPGIELGPFQPTFVAGVRAADLIMAGRMTAVVAFNDELAAGVVNRLVERGLHIPGDLSVVGFDDTSLAEMVTPSLTTVRLPAATAGGVAVDLLLDVMCGGEAVCRAPIELSTELIVRASTGPAPLLHRNTGSVA